MGDYSSEKKQQAPFDDVITKKKITLIVFFIQTISDIKVIGMVSVVSSF